VPNRRNPPHSCRGALAAGQGIGSILVNGCIPGIEAIRPGVTERDVHRVIWQEWVREDRFETPCMTNPVLFLCGSDGPGKRRIVTTPFYDRVIQKGDQGFSDCGPSYKGYWTDLQRCFYVGDKLPPRLAEKETYRQDWNQFVPIEFVGHGIGTMNHEPPWLAEDDLTELRPGMTLCIEVGCYDSELVYYGNMPEDIWLVTDKGLDRIGVDLPHDIWLCG